MKPLTPKINLSERLIQRCVGDQGISTRDELIDYVIKKRMGGALTWERPIIQKTIGPHDLGHFDYRETLIRDHKKKLELDLDSTNEELRHKSMDKIIKLMPFVIAKEKSPAIQLNVQNNVPAGPQITAGKSTVLAVGTIQDYLKKREKRMSQMSLPPIEEAEIIEVKNGNKEKKIKEANRISPIRQSESTDEESEE